MTTCLFFFLIIRPPPRSPLFPYTTLFRSQRLLDALAPSPAYAITAGWTIVGWNRAYERLYPGVAAVPAAERNLLWLVFTDPAVRSLLADWAGDSRRFLTQFRAEVGPRLADPEAVDLVARLEAASPHFRTGWATHDVDRFSILERRLRRTPA